MTELIKETSRIRHSTWVELRADALLENLRILRKISGQNDALAVIKANAYGHGLKEIAHALAGHVTYFGVATLREALELKEHHPQTPVFLFGHLFSHEIPAALLGGITLSVSNFEKAAEISKVSEDLDRKTSVHVKIDTGMGRMGIPVNHAGPVIEKMIALKGISLDGIYTHFAASEKDDSFRESQVREFGLLLQSLEKRGILFRFRHLSNSAASLTLKTPMINMIRPGLALYGLYPDENLRNAARFESVLSLRSRVILIKKIRAGESVGYGREFIAKTDTTIAVIPIGYSHGYPYTAWKKACVLYRGKRCPFAGKVSMDYITVNLGDQDAKEGDTITLIGSDGDERITAEELADWAGTIPYEIVTRLSSHLPRLVINNE
ncbi:MAG TPA: alanine racemase [Candidatus Omnitrophota bacterium]|nr:alanine racemase [Candidatus Omnitrophota bacterium]HPS36949.1 alanine racemase [Candidatus Omnitrophota bacterium]